MNINIQAAKKFHLLMNQLEFTLVTLISLCFILTFIYITVAKT